MKVQAKVITEQECKWHGVALQDMEVAEIRVAAWFLTEKSCGIKNRQYDFEGVKAKKKAASSEVTQMLVLGVVFS